MVQKKIIKDAKYWEAFKARKTKFDEANRDYSEKRRCEEEEHAGKFKDWLTKNGLNKEAYDETVHGPVYHRCTDKVLCTLFDEQYVRPDGWNLNERYFEIIFIRCNIFSVTKKYIKCDKLFGAQFDHLCAIKLGTYDMHDSAEKRVELWFTKKHDDDEDSADYDEANPSVSHVFERGSLISKCEDLDHSPMQAVFSAIIKIDH